MALNSINTNAGAMIALQNLNSTNQSLAGVQTRINTGLKVASAKDNGAIWAIAQNQRSDIGALDSVRESLQRSQSSVDVAISASESISDLLNQMKAKALAASDVTLDANSRASLQNDFNSLRVQISKTISNANFNGTNLLQTGASSLYALADSSGTGKLTVQSQVLGLGTGAGTILTFSLGLTFTTATNASAALTKINTSISNLNNAIARLGTSSKSLQTHLDFVNKLQDSMTAGVGNLVDADVAKESATLQALQTKQQLGIQALSIANQSTGTLLSLFR